MPCLLRCKTKITGPAMRERVVETLPIKPAPPVTIALKRRNLNMESYGQRASVVVELSGLADFLKHLRRLPLLPPLGPVVNGKEAEAHGVSLGLFEVVHQRPVEVSLDWQAIDVDRVCQSLQVVPGEPGPLLVLRVCDSILQDVDGNPVPVEHPV